MEDPTEEQQTIQRQYQPVELPFFQRIPSTTFAFLSLCIVFFLYQVVGGALTWFLFKGDVTEGNVQAIRWATLLGQLLLILVPTLVLVRLRYHDLREFFQVRVPDYREIISTVIAVFALQQLLQGYMTFQDSIPMPETIQKFIDQFKQLIEEAYRLLVEAHSPGEFIFVVFVVALIPAVCEELLFRGLVQRSFELDFPGLRGAVVAGIIFGAYHLNPFSIVPLVTLGIYFGFIVHRSRNITVAMSAHFFNNFVACVAIYMQLDDNFVVIAPQGNPSSSLLALNYLLFTLVFVAATYYFVRVTQASKNE